jgi:hypothetical protein
MRLGSLQRGLESRPCREILYIRCTRIVCCFVPLVCQSIVESPPPLNTLQTIVLLL